MWSAAWENHRINLSWPSDLRSVFHIEEEKDFCGVSHLSFYDPQTRVGRAGYLEIYKTP